MLLLTYSHSDANAVCRDTRLLASRGFKKCWLDALPKPEDIKNGEFIIVSLDNIADIEAVHPHLREHKRVFFQIAVTEHVAAEVIRNHFPYHLIAPRKADRIYWKLACAYDELKLEFQKEWDREWEIMTETLPTHHLADGVSILRNERQSASVCLDNIKGFA